MHLTTPSCLADVIADGIFVSAATDLAFEEAFGHISSVEFNFRGKVVSADGTPALDTPVDVRITSSAGIRDILGHRIAVIDGTAWTWSTAATQGIELPECTGTVAYSPAIVRAARTLVAGRPVLIAEQNSHLAAIALDFRPSGVPDSEALCRGLSQMPYGTDEQRALTAYTVATGHDSAHHMATLTDNYIDHIRVARPGALSLPEVIADAHFRAVEQQLFYSGRFPNAQIHIDLNSGQAHIASGSHVFSAAAHVIATVSSASTAYPIHHSDKVWTWAWADPGLKNSISQKASFNLRRFGADNGIAAFLRPQMPAVLAQSLHLAQAAMPVLSVWTLDSVTLAQDVLGIVLLDAPALALPELSDSVRAATLRAPLPHGIDGARARTAYEAARRA